MRGRVHIMLLLLLRDIFSRFAPRGEQSDEWISNPKIELEGLCYRSKGGGTTAVKIRGIRHPPSSLESDDIFIGHDGEVCYILWQISTKISHKARPISICSSMDLLRQGHEHNLLCESYVD